MHAAIVVVSQGLVSESNVGLGDQEAEPCTNGVQQRHGVSAFGRPRRFGVSGAYSAGSITPA